MVNALALCKESERVCGAPVAASADPGTVTVTLLQRLQPAKV